MMLSKQRRAYMAILGLACAAWAGDRVFLAGGPAPAAAGAVVPTDLLIPSARPAGADAVGAAPITGPSLAQRLEKLRSASTAGEAPVGDAFRIPPDWGALKSADAADPGVRAQPIVDNRFARSHTLTRVLVGSQPSFNTAVVDGGSLLRVGEKLDGMTLREVTAEGAVFEGDGVTVELTINRPDGPTGKVGAGSEKDRSAAEPR